MSQPAHKIRKANLSITIWRNTGDKGPWYSVVPSRSYKDSDDQWRQTDTLGGDDLLPMAKLLDQGDTWITAQAEADRKDRKAKSAA